MAPYKESFPVGTTIRILERRALENFMATWRYHHPLQPDQLGFAGKESSVKGVGFYHGGDVLYELSDAPGIWHEACLSAV